jgi:hypothetical protein
VKRSSLGDTWTALELIREECVCQSESDDNSI